MKTCKPWTIQAHHPNVQIPWWCYRLLNLLLLFSRSDMKDSLWPNGVQHIRLPCPSQSHSLLKLMCTESVRPSNRLILCHLLLLLPSIFPSIRVFSNELVLHSKWPKYWNFSFNISPSNAYSGFISFRIWLVWSPCSPRDSQESSPTPQFKIINSSALSFLYSPTLTSIHNYWKNTTLTEWTCWQRNVSAF